MTNDLTNEIIKVLGGMYPQEKLENVDWHTVTQHFLPQVTCCQCHDTILADGGWLQHENQWYCKDCREDVADWHVCAHCLQTFPEEQMQYLTWAMSGEGFYCQDCEEKVRPYWGCILVDKATGKEYFQVGDDLGAGSIFITSGLGEKRVRVTWFKWGYVSEAKRSPLNVVYTGVCLQDLRFPNEREKAIFEREKNKKEQGK